ncbi:SUKH-3 domain-containing protein [Kitasatospora sp. NPDC058170]|uniref:SUKH-3 domain-containing protein n=1 Tax=Kitasatospora sp. NPDC058170 TaxID=3346364 RepID=UPI0036D83DB7
MTRSLSGGDADVRTALLAAGWFEGRRYETATWRRQLVAAGFEINDLAVRVWSEFGMLRVVSSSLREQGCSIVVDPADACIDTMDEAAEIAGRLGQNYSPLGMWSSQFRAYIGVDGHTIAIGPASLWNLGDSFAEALKATVLGRPGVDRPESIDWLP